MIQNTNKDILAKLMATENITVIHKAVPTAYFDVKSRTLCVPILKGEMSPELNDLFVGHEVGHALNTPLDGWHGAVSKKGQLFKGYLNVIEDVRIEKKIKSKYPGLRKSFYAGYKDLANQDFFGIRGKNLTDLNLIDRINLFYKIGSITQITFNEEETPYINRCEKLETFEEVMELATELFERQQQITEDELESLTDQEIQDMMDDMDISQEEGEDEDTDSMTVTLEEKEDDSEDDSEDGSDAKSDNTEESDTTEDDTNSTDGSDDTPSNGEETTEDTDTKSKEGSKGKSPLEQLQDELNKSLSDETFRKEEESLYDTSELHEPTYCELPSRIKSENYIADWKEIDKIMSKENVHGESFNRSLIQGQVKDFVTSNKKIINYMVKEFEMKKAAADYKRSWSSKSGELNMDRLPFYKLKDDIFNRIQITPEGKNHGVVMILDWSGSMSGSVKSTMEQATLLSMFCRRLSIPFRLFAFSDSYKRESYPKDIQDMDDWRAQETKKSEYDSEKMFGKKVEDMNWSLGNLTLLEIYNEKMSNLEFNRCMENWFQLSESIEGRYNYGEEHGYDTDFYTPTGLYLSGTPLDASIVVMRDYLKEFKTKYNIDVCSFITLTDGASHGCMRGHNLHLLDRQLNKTFNLDSSKYSSQRTTTHNLLKWLKETTGVRTIGFYLASSRGDSVVWDAQHFCGTKMDTYSTESDKKKKEFNKLSTSFTDGCYDLAILINQRKLKLNYEEDILDVPTGANKGVLKRALVKAGSNKMKQRVILNQFVGQMAV